MAQKRVEIADIGEVLLQRRKGTKHIRVSIRYDGTVRVGMPPWMPYKTALVFVRTQQDWIRKHQTTTEKTQILLVPGATIGKAHHLTFQESSAAKKATGRLVGSEVRITHPEGFLYKDEMVQQAAERAATRALTRQATQLLPQRLDELAERHGFHYRSVSIKRLRTRWGSCSNHQDIVLNCYLVQLPWELIDYVLLHELLHTTIMRHGEPFWSALAEYVPNLTAVRASMRTYTPRVFVTRGSAVVN